MCGQSDGNPRRFDPRPFALAACCGVLAALPWHFPGLFPITWIALAAWIAITPRSPRAACGLWLAGGIAFITTALYWLPEAAALRLGVSYGSGTLAAATIIFWDALRFGVFGYLVAWLRPRGTVGILAWPVVWVALELVWPQVFPWRIGQTQLGWLALCQIAEVAGVYGISFLLVWTSAAVGVWLRERHRPPPPPARASRWAMAMAAVAVAVASGWGCWRMADIERSVSDHPRLRVALVQPGSIGEGMAESLRSQSLALPGDVDLVVWGEGTIGRFPLSLMSFGSQPDVGGESPLADESEAPYRELQRPLLGGGGSFVSGGGSSEPLRNTAYLIDAEKTVLGRYHKRVLMPWGEYAVGQEWVPGLRRVMGDIDELVPGTSAAPLTLPGRGRLGVLICYEDLTSEPPRRTVLEGGQVLFNLNNLATFGDTPAAVQHQRLAVFRAIENRRWLVRCGTTGSTAVISATGRVEHQALLREPAVVVASVPLLERQTVYTRRGDSFAVGCVIIAALWCFCTMAFRKEASGGPPRFGGPLTACYSSGFSWASVKNADHNRH